MHLNFAGTTARIGWIMLLWFFTPGAQAAEPWPLIDAEIAQHPNLSGVYVLERGQDALLTRAWLADSARTSIEVQYFIWSTDNIGILASAALLRAADRGVRVRVIVDDLLIDAPDESLLALARHPNIDIRIYNPQHSVGTPLRKRLLNIATDFRGVNQRMHDKTFVVDGKVAIAGGRNMAGEYFDFNHHYNFRDRDALVVGAVVADVQVSFERFWSSGLAISVEELYDGLGLMQKNVSVDGQQIRKIYAELAQYANDPANFAPEMRASIATIANNFPRFGPALRWSKVSFVSDVPGKNKNRYSLGGGGRSAAALAEALADAQHDVRIQSPYLVLSDAALHLFKQLRQRGVAIRISTNSLASTDNLQAFSGYRNQRQALLDLGIEIYEFRPNPAIERDVMQRYQALQREAPVFALHAKTLVVDGKTVVIGTYNLDPRSENLNTEIGLLIRDSVIAQQVATAIETDMRPENSWNARTDNPDRHAALAKRSRVRLLQMLPIRPLL